MSAKRPKLVGVIGRAQHGKSTVGAILEEHMGFRPVAFADALRDAMTKLDPIVALRWDSNDNVKEYVRYTDAIKEYGYETAKADFSEVRRLLQVFGTEVVRDLFGPDAWVDALDKTVFDDEDELEQFVITDVRFPNEAEYVRRNNGILIKVTRPDYHNGVDAKHASEALVDTLPWDYSAVNSGSIDDLRVTVLAIMQMEHMYPKAGWQRGGELEASTTA